MSKHGGDKKRKSQATPPKREGDKGTNLGFREGRTAEPKRCRTIRHPLASPKSWTVPIPEQIAVRAYEN